MTRLDWSRQSRTKIENVPPSVTEFICIGNQIQKIENVPPSVTEFYCLGNQIIKIENVQPVSNFYCGWNQITKIENIPPSVTRFGCRANQIRKIENLPAGLTEFYYDDNPITHVDDVPITWWNQRGEFKLKYYNLIKRLQRRIKLRVKRNKAARVIQNACHNWLWSTKCRDGTTGIVLRLSLRELTQAGLIKD